MVTFKNENGENPQMEHRYWVQEIAYHPMVFHQGDKFGVKSAMFVNTLYSVSLCIGCDVCKYTVHVGSVETPFTSKANA